MGLLNTLGKIALLGVVAVAALTIVGKVRQHEANAPAKLATAPSAAGFVMLNPDDAKVPHVIVMAAPNCPREEAQRARALAASIQAAGVPCKVESQISFSFTSEEEGARIQKFMDNAPAPHVFIRGRAKGNPTLAEVLAEYRAGK